VEQDILAKDAVRLRKRYQAAKDKLRSWRSTPACIPVVAATERTLV
jgi:hypothetical protein